MPYDSLTTNRKLLHYLFNRKIFKKNYFFADNEEGYEWDDYDTTHFYGEGKYTTTITIDNSIVEKYSKLYAFGVLKKNFDLCN